MNTAQLPNFLKARKSRLCFILCVIRSTSNHVHLGLMFILDALSISWLDYTGIHPLIKVDQSLGDRSLQNPKRLGISPQDHVMILLDSWMALSLLTRGPRCATLKKEILSNRNFVQSINSFSKRTDSTIGWRLLWNI